MASEIDKTSREAFKITAKVSTPSAETLQAVRSGMDSCHGQEGRTSQAVVCPICDGIGHVGDSEHIDHVCHGCGGKGWVELTGESERQYVPWPQYFPVPVTPIPDWLPPPPMWICTN